MKSWCYLLRTFAMNFKEAAVQKMAWVPLSGRTITRWSDEIAEDIEAQLLQRTGALWCAIQADESTSVDNSTRMFCVVWYQEDVHKRICRVHFCCQPILQLQDHVFEYLHIRKTEVVILCRYTYGQNGCHDWMTFWFCYSGQRGSFWMRTYTLCHP